MTCKDCIHEKICDHFILQGLPWGDGKFPAEMFCDLFKPKSRYIELPCAVGDTVYQIVYCRCGNPQCYEQGHCWKTITKATPKSYGHIMKLQMGRKLFFDNLGRPERRYAPKGTICYKIYKKSFDLKMIADFGKTVFLTKEEAEKALEERK